MSSRLVAGALVVVLIHLASLLPLRGINSLTHFVQALAKLLPGFSPAVQLLSLVFVDALPAHGVCGSFTDERLKLNEKTLGRIETLSWKLTFIAAPFAP